MPRTSTRARRWRRAGGLLACLAAAGLATGLIASSFSPPGSEALAFALTSVPWLVAATLGENAHAPSEPAFWTATTVQFTLVALLVGRAWRRGSRVRGEEDHG